MRVRVPLPALSPGWHGFLLARVPPLNHPGPNNNSSGQIPYQITGLTPSPHTDTLKCGRTASLKYLQLTSEPLVKRVQTDYERTCKQRHCWGESQARGQTTHADAQNVNSLAQVKVNEVQTLRSVDSWPRSKADHSICCAPRTSCTTTCAATCATDRATGVMKLLCVKVNSCKIWGVKKKKKCQKWFFFFVAHWRQSEYGTRQRGMFKWYMRCRYCKIVNSSIFL